jgi:isochorismate hydrolase
MSSSIRERIAADESGRWLLPPRCFCSVRPAMTTLPNRSNTALLVVDVQNGVVKTAHARDTVVANIAQVVEKARAARAPVLWVQHTDGNLKRGSEPWQIVPELEPAAGETKLEKQYGDSFEATSLEETLARLAVGHLVIVGAQTDACIRATLHGAFVRGYDVTLVGDAHTTENHTAYGAPPPDKVIAHTNLYWKYEEAPGRKAATVETNALTFA